MAKFVPNPDQFPEVDSINITDPVLGGSDGQINKTLQQLVDRTANLQQNKVSGNPNPEEPTFEESPTGPTPSPGDNSDKMATTEYVDRAIDIYDKTIVHPENIIPNSSNLNSYIGRGTYRVISETSAATITNIPTQIAGTLEVDTVVVSSTDTRITQIYKAISTTNTQSELQYRRIGRNLSGATTFGAWKQYQIGPANTFGFNTTLEVTASTQAAQAPNVGATTATGITAGTVSLQVLLQKLVNLSHRHPTFNNGVTDYCTYCSYCTAFCTHCTYCTAFCTYCTNCTYCSYCSYCVYCGNCSDCSDFHQCASPNNYSRFDMLY